MVNLKLYAYIDRKVYIIIVPSYHRILMRSRHFGVAPDLSDFKKTAFPSKLRFLVITGNLR